VATTATFWSARYEPAPNWEQRLHDVRSTAAFERPHVYGEHDCLLWSAAVVKAVTGKDLARGHRRKYRTGPARPLPQAHRLRQRQAMIDAHLEEKPIGFAQVGDLVLVPGDQGGWRGGPGAVLRRLSRW
jgi:hypothetical protein